MLEHARRRIGEAIQRVAPGPWRHTLTTRLFALTRIPLLAALRPEVLELNDHRCVVRLPLNRFSQNHLGSMYFGALAVGADCAGGLIAMRLISRSGRRISLVFQDFHADFLRRAQGDVHFVCDDGAAIRRLVETAASSTERVSHRVEVVAYVPSDDPDEPVARFALTLSLKQRAH